VTRQTDLFDRLAHREAKLRGKRLEIDNPNAMLSFVLRLQAALVAFWALLVGVHWLAFSNPRWLAITHTIVFTLVVAYWIAAIVFLRAMRRRMPELFEDE
jgi:hypothetical protein